MAMQPLEYLESTYVESEEIRSEFFRRQKQDLIRGAGMVGETFASGGKVLICGNGGSAADAQHMAAEMVGRMLIDRRPLPSIALTTDSSNLTAIANDFSYDEVFAFQVKALGKAGDLLIAISTSGNSKNVIRAVEEAKGLGMKVLSLTGGSGGKLSQLSDLNFNAALGKNSSRIQETHLFIVHSLVDLCDRFFLKA